MDPQAYIVKSKMPASKYFFYRYSGFEYKNCKVIIVTCENLFDDFSLTMRKTHGIDNSVACHLFMEDTEPEKMVSELELFISHTNHEMGDPLRVFLDVASLYRKKGVSECKSILDTLDSYMALKNVEYVFAPPILSPEDMPQMETIVEIQEFANKLNLSRMRNPVFPFRWIMKERRDKTLQIIPSNWVENGAQLSLKGSLQYMKGIWRYISATFYAPLRDCDLTSRLHQPMNDNQANQEVVEENLNQMDEGSYQDAEVVGQVVEVVGQGAGGSDQGAGGSDQVAEDYNWVAGDYNWVAGDYNWVAGDYNQFAGSSGQEIGRSVSWSDDLREEIAERRMENRNNEDLRIRLAERRILQELQQIRRLGGLPGARVPSRFQRFIDDML